MDELYNKILSLLKSHGKSFGDIEWIECAEETAFNNEANPRYEITIDNFIESLHNTLYDADEYYHELNPNLKIVGKNRSFLITIGEYDGNMFPVYTSFELERPKEIKTIENFKSNRSTRGNFLRTIA